MNPRTTLLAGLGNTGSHLAPLLARMGCCERLVLCDPDTVDEGNMAAQAYGREALGKAKVAAMAEHLRGVNPDLVIDPFRGELEDLPLGEFAGTVVLCLDQDASRQVAAERAWSMGGILYDVAVNGPAGLARVSRIAGRDGEACLQCGWPESQYANLPVRHSCRKTPPTNAPAALGSFAASLAALQILSPEPRDTNFEVIASPAAGEMFVSTLTENPQCRFNHDAPGLEHFGALDLSTPLGILFERLQTQTLEAPGFSFGNRLRCVACGDEEVVLLISRGNPTSAACESCGGELELSTFHARRRLRISQLTDSEKSMSLEAIGLRDGDVLRADLNRWIRIALRQPEPSLSHSHV